MFVAISVLIVAALGAGFIFVWNVQRSLVFVPNASPAGSAAEALEGGRDVTMHTEDGLRLGAWIFSPPAGVDRDIAVLYAPGNAGNRTARVGIARELTDRGFTVLLLDYRGYGGNPGSPSQTGLARDAVAGVNALESEGFSLDRTLYFGESIGTGVIASLQTTHPPAGVLLRSPFPDFVAVASEHYGHLPVGMLLRDRFPITEHVHNSPVPMTVVYGTADEIVPPALSIEVAEAIENLHEELVLEGVGHNDAEMFDAPVADALSRLADHVA